MSAIRSSINIQSPPANVPWNSSKMHWKTFLQNPLRPSRSARYGNDKNKKTVSTSPSGRFSALPFLLIILFIPGFLIHRFPPKKQWVFFIWSFVFQLFHCFFDPCTCFLKILFVTKIVIKEPCPIKGMALIITLHFQAFLFHSVLLQHLRDCICSL